MNITGRKDLQQITFTLALHKMSCISIKRRPQDFCYITWWKCLEVVNDTFLYIFKNVVVHVPVAQHLRSKYIALCIFVLLNFVLFFLQGLPDHIPCDWGLLKCCFSSWALPIPVSASPLEFLVTMSFLTLFWTCWYYLAPQTPMAENLKN